MGRPQNDKSRDELFATDLAHCWHPFTPMSAYPNEAPLMIESAEGHQLTDVDGNSYLDGVSSLWCNLLGHRHPKISEAIKAQVDKVAHTTFLGNSNPVAVELAERLVALAPLSLNRVFFSDNGSTAVEVALKIALQYHQQSAAPGGAERTRFLSLGLAYHGDTIGSVSLGGIPAIHDRFRPLRFDVIRGPSPYCYRCPLGLERETCKEACLQDVLALIEEHGATLAGVVIEPGFQGAGGIITYPDGYLAAVESATKKVGALLIFDEVASGMGRSGDLFVSETEFIEPDLLCMAKGLTGGYLPMAATLATEEIYEVFLGPPEAGRTFYHGHTFTGNQLAAAAALATLDALEDEDILAQVPERIETLAESLTKLSDLEIVGDIRQYGLAVGIEVVADKATRQSFPADKRVGMRICRHALDEGLFLRPLGDVLVLMPSLNFSNDEITTLVEGLGRAIKRTQDELGR
ncbi:MAG: adenosylmethionine-8-amino-7-oxononanoate aminotransferase [Planctomycetota bacterium]|jgi:adenosylmethionine-8-amino-7-oxononanoate aminotransferase